MPILMDVYAGETDPLVFPLTVNGSPMNLSGVSVVALVKSGLDGRLQATQISGATVSVYDSLGGLVRWAQTASDLDDGQSPYRIYFRCTTSGGVLTVPRGDYFLITVHPNLL